MKREHFVKLAMRGSSPNGKKILKSGRSVTDPTFARSGRQLIFQPLAIEYRMKYPAGVPLDKDNPYNIREYDKIYPDTFKAIAAANADVNDTKSKLNKFKEQQNRKPQQEPQQPQSEPQQ